MIRVPMALQIMRIVRTHKVAQTYAQFALNPWNRTKTGIIPNVLEMGTHKIGFLGWEGKNLINNFRRADCEAILEITKSLI